MYYPYTSSDIFNGLASGSAAERRALVEQQDAALLAERKQQLLAQRSTQSSANNRICLWEKLHRLHLPRDLNHKLLSVIAKETALTLADVQQEQVRRRTKKPAPVSK